MSRAAFPKQFLPSPNGKTFIQETAERVRHLNGFQHLMVSCNEMHRFVVIEQLEDVGIEPEAIIAEPSMRDTAPAIALLCHHAIKQLPEDALLLILPSDHLIPDHRAFTATVNEGAPLAAAGNIVTFGITPTHPATAYGYIEQGEKVAHGYKVKRFVEKPDTTHAKKYLTKKNFSWNAGIFLFKPHILLEALEKYAPDIATAAASAAATLSKDRFFYRPHAVRYNDCPKNSIDYAVMENAKNVALVPFRGYWNDVGSWNSMWEEAFKDESGNAVIGNALLTDCKDCYIRSDGSSLIAAVGLQDHVIVHTKDATLILPRDQAHQVKSIYSRLEAAGDDLHINHTTDHRPWGGFEKLAEHESYKVKHLWVKPNSKLSLQSHQHRSEHWIIISGTAKITLDDKVQILKAGESTFVPVGTKHQLENETSDLLHIIEVQTGSYFGEDDIVRYDDIYGRIPHENIPAMVIRGEKGELSAKNRDVLEPENEQSPRIKLPGT
jgi:mannose-1-phosphate guanylyltransferase/mannose-6-phosphate isomerase